jgi:hypothetical protein
MSLPPRAFYSLTETSARWGCAAADLAGWAATDHLTLVTSIASVICGKQPVAGSWCQRGRHDADVPPSWSER